MKNLHDSFGRRHDYLRISIIEKCNLRCTYCMPEQGVPLTPRNLLMTAYEIEHISKTFVNFGIQKIRLTGGEPLLRKDFGEILSLLSKLNVELAITTNGLLLDRYVNEFEKYGLNSINISMDTMDPDKFLKITKKNYLSKLLSGIELLLQRGFHVKLNVVTIKGFNEDEIIDFIRWTKDKNLHVRFIEFMPFAGNKWDIQKVFSYKNIMNTIQTSFKVEKLNDKPNATTKAYKIEGYKGTFASISSVTDHFCGNCNRLRLTADGKMKNCLFSKGEMDLLSPLREGKEIEGLIRANLFEKHYKHGGINDILNGNIDNSKFSDRSMILIGG